jgi:FAD/FMN-containing dehydrogenase
VVGGSARTVSACGGYTLGGGHSFMSPAYGLAVDNVLAFTAVLANGSVVTASPCANPDLFWALRGGGGGSFAVVTAATYALHPTPPGGVTGFVVAMSFLRGQASAELFMGGLLAAAPALGNPAGTGVVAAGYWSLAVDGFTAVFVFNGSNAAAQAALAPISNFIAAHGDDINVTSAEYFAAPSMSVWHDIIDPADPTGTPETLGSRLIPVAVAGNATAAAPIAAALANISASVVVQGMMVTGGAVAAFDRDSNQTSVTPAWRDAALHVAVGIGWGLSTPIAEQEYYFAVVSAWTSWLRDATPGSGAYWSESDYAEPDWQQAFWGSANYARLAAIKAAYDPTGVFVCHHCVELP